MAIFFAVHYGIFHLAYLFFLTTLIDIHKIDWQFVKISFFAMLSASVANFVQNKIRNRTQDVNISAMHVGRCAPRADALMILALDEDVPPEVAEAIRAHDSVIELWTIRLGRDR